VFADPTGAAFSVWQPDQMNGAAVVNEPGAFSWAELMTRDLPTAGAFYGAAFDWTEKNGDDSPYKEFEVDGHVVAGGQAIASEMPAEVRAHWNIYFDVPDVGRMAVVGGPHHEGFSLFEFAG